MDVPVTTSAPDISVVIATYNRAPLLTRHLEALAAQDIDPSRFEVLVVDDGSRDDSMQRLADFAPRAPFAFHYQSQANAGAAVARNTAIAHARSELLLFSNDDTFPIPSLLRDHLAFHAAHPEPTWGAVGAVSLAEEMPSSPFTRLHHAQWDALQPNVDLPFTAFITANISIKRSLLAQHGGFAYGQMWHEDIELGRRLMRAGLRLRYLPHARAFHHHAIDEGEMRRMAKRDGQQLVAWYRRDAEALADLELLGLAGPPPLRRTARQRLSAAVVSPLTAPVIAAVARAASDVAPDAALRLWRAIFVHERREAIVQTLRQSA